MVASSGGVLAEPGQGGVEEDALQRSPASLLFTAAAYVLQGTTVDTIKFTHHSSTDVKLILH